MIEDKELRDLFRIECEEHLQCLDDGLLNLEQRPADQTQLEDVFRAAHSIKGAARMLGLNDIQSVAHILEDSLAAIRNGDALVEKTLTADLYQKLDVVRRLVEEAVGESMGTDALATVSAAAIDEVAVVVSKPVIEPVIEVPKPANLPTPALTQAKESEPTKAAFQIGTLRVEPQRLDALLTHTGELAVTNAHIARRLKEIDTLVDHYEEWTRSLKSMGLSLENETLALKGLGQMQTRLAQLRLGFIEDSRRLDFVSEQLGTGIRAIRLLPFSTIFKQFPRMVHELAATLHKDVELVMEGAEVVADKRILEELKDPIMHLLRNAIHHGVEDGQQRLNSGKAKSGTILIRASQSADYIVLEVQDDGYGLNIAEIKHIALKRGLHSEEQLALMNDQQIQGLILSPGFTTSHFITEISGRGVGLDVVRTNVENLKGSIQIDSTAGKGVTFRLQVPMTLATMRVQIVGVQGRSYALPLKAIQFSRRIKACDLFTMEGKQTLSIAGQPVAVTYLADLLELKRTVNPQTEMMYSTFLKIDNEFFGLIVDELLDETEVILKTQSQLLKRVRNVLATTILVSGEVCPVLNPADLLKSMRKYYLHGSTASRFEIAAVDNSRKKALLLVEDSITTRTQEKRILESAGYDVTTAVDGIDGYNKFQSGQFDGLVSDVEMPNMNGFELTRAIRKVKQHADIPIILVTSLSSDAHQREGLEAGADAYLVKSAFDQKVLLDCLARLV